MPVNKALQLIEMLNEHHIHGSDATWMMQSAHEHPTGHVIRTSNWRNPPPEQRPTFTQVASLA